MAPTDKANALVKADDIAEAHEESAKVYGYIIYTL